MTTSVSVHNVHRVKLVTHEVTGSHWTNMVVYGKDGNELLEVTLFHGKRDLDVDTEDTRMDNGEGYNDR